MRAVIDLHSSKQQLYVYTFGSYIVFPDISAIFSKRFPFFPFSNFERDYYIRECEKEEEDVCLF